jgi:hypothetical protein
MLLLVTVTFGETMETYSSTLRSVLTSMREGLKLDITAAAAQVSLSWLGPGLERHCHGAAE